MTYALRFEEVVKRYTRGGGGEGPRYASIRHDVAVAMRGAIGRWRGRPTPPRGQAALDRVSFEVQEGESFALVGPNGAGKSTALKIISRITYPTSGRVRVRGRVGALMEVGSGVHPELTGRENIWLYGQILGMPKQEVRRRFDEIVDFAEIGQALDRPVKMYSSGMQLRLGFAIASHLDPDVFVVDEALAVGDAGFQAKCVRRMAALVAEGHTLVFVSHDLSAVEAVCKRGAFLLDGRIHTEDEVRPVLRAYLDWVDAGQARGGAAETRIAGPGFTIERVTVHGASGTEINVLSPGDPLEVRFRIRATERVSSPWFSLGISQGGIDTLVMCSMLEDHEPFDLSPGQHDVICRTEPLPLNPRVYELWMSIRGQDGLGDLVGWQPVGSIRIRSDVNGKGVASLTTSWLYGPIKVGHRWSIDPTS